MEQTIKHAFDGVSDSVTGTTATLAAEALVINTVGYSETLLIIKNTHAFACDVVHDHGQNPCRWSSRSNFNRSIACSTLTGLSRSPRSLFPDRDFGYRCCTGRPCDISDRLQPTKVIVGDRPEEKC